MNKAFILLSVSIIFNTTSFNILYAGRTGQTRQEAIQAQRIAIKQAKQSREQVTMPQLSSIRPAHIPMASKLLFCILACGLVLQPVEAALVSRRSEPATKKIVLADVFVKQLHDGPQICRTCCQDNYNRTDQVCRDFGPSYKEHYPCGFNMYNPLDKEAGLESVCVCSPSPDWGPAKKTELRNIANAFKYDETELRALAYHESTHELSNPAAKPAANNIEAESALCFAGFQAAFGFDPANGPAGLRIDALNRPRDKTKN